MRCSKCNRNNKKIALYCKRCGTKFSEEELKKARKNSIIGLFDFLKNIYDICTLKIITDTLLFKILSIVFVFGVGIYYVIISGIHFKIMEGDDYLVQYNKEKEEYYIISENEKVDIQLYIPNGVNDITVKEYDDNVLISNDTFDKDESISLNKNNDNYYSLEANYDKNKEVIKLYVFESSDLIEGEIDEQD